MEETLTQLVRDTGPYAAPALFLAAMLEYVFPPFPGDTVVVLGAFYVVKGALPLWLVFAAVTVGSVAGSAVDYWVGVRLERRAEKGKHHDRIARVEAAYRRHGDLYIVINRFLPGVRSLFFVAAGMAGLPVRRVLSLGALSAALWNAALLAAGYAVGDNLDELLWLVRTYAAVAWVALALVATWFLLRWARNKRAR